MLSSVSIKGNICRKGFTMRLSLFVFLGVVPLTPSTTEESMVASGSTSITAKRNGSAAQLQRLPGVEPISGHDVSAGWL